MKATVQRMNSALRSCEAVTENNLLLVFPLPETGGPQVGDRIELDPSILGLPQVVQNLSSRGTFTVCLRPDDIHDLDLPMGHGTSRSPSEERLKGG
jgi:hypothetical protein